jgi:hypothetical protein
MEMVAIVTKLLKNIWVGKRAATPDGRSIVIDINHGRKVTSALNMVM